jgi:hypothetical protein
MERCQIRWHEIRSECAQSLSPRVHRCQICWHGTFVPCCPISLNLRQSHQVEASCDVPHDRETRCHTEASIRGKSELILLSPFRKLPYYGETNRVPTVSRDHEATQVFQAMRASGLMRQDTCQRIWHRAKKLAPTCPSSTSATHPPGNRAQHVALQPADIAFPLRASCAQCQNTCGHPVGADRMDNSRRARCVFRGLPALREQRYPVP